MWSISYHRGHCCYGTIASPLWLELRGPAAWQANPSLAVCRLACHRLLPWLRVTFAMVPDAARPGSDQGPWSTAPATSPAGGLGGPSASDPWDVVCCAVSFCCPRCVRACGDRGLWRFFTGARVLCVLCAVSVGTWRLYTGVHAVCGTRVLLVASVPPPPPFISCLKFSSFSFCFFLFF